MRFKRGYVRLPRELANAVTWAKKALDEYQVDRCLREHTRSEGHYEATIQALKTIAFLRDELGYWIEEAEK